MNRFGRWVSRNGRIVLVFTGAELVGIEGSPESGASDLSTDLSVPRRSPSNSLVEISQQEIQRVTNYFEQHPQLSHAILPTVHFSQQEFAGLLDNAAAVVANLKLPSTIHDAERNISNEPTENNTLEQLREHCSCDICLEPKAAPVVLNCRCARSFCGHCVNEWINVGGRNDCPRCRAEFSRRDIQYVRDFDESIVLIMADVPDCETKEDWQARRNSYLEYRSRNGLEGDENITNAEAARRVRGDGRGGGGAGGDGGGAFQSEFFGRDAGQYLLYKQCVVILAFALISLIKEFRA